MPNKQYTKAEKLAMIDAFAKQFPNLEASMQMLDKMRAIHATMKENELFVSDEATAFFQSFCDTVMQGAAEFLEDQAKAHSQSKMNWAWISQ